MPHTGTPPSDRSQQEPLRGWRRWMILGPGRRFVPGVTTGICRRPDDRPRAETHPPNASMNVCLVDSWPHAGVLALVRFVLLPRKPSRPRRAYLIKSSASRLCGVPPNLADNKIRAANCNRCAAKMEPRRVRHDGRLERPELYYAERGEQRDEDRLVDKVDEERVSPERNERSRGCWRFLHQPYRPLPATVHDVPDEQADEDHPEPGEHGSVVRHEQVLRDDAEREQPRALRGDVARHHVRPDGYEGNAQKQVREPVLEERVGEDHGDPDDVQYAESDDPHPQGKAHDGQRHTVGEDSQSPQQVLPEEAPVRPTGGGPRVADGERDPHEEQERARGGVGEPRPESGGRIDVVAAEGVQVVREVVDDHHEYGDPAGGIHLPESLVLVCGIALRARLLVLGVFPDHNPAQAPGRRNRSRPIGYD